MSYDRRRAALASIRARERAELARLRLELAGAKAQRKRLVSEARALCKRGRLTLIEKIRAERAALKLKAAAARKAERAACRARKAVARSSGARSVAAVKTAIVAERALVKAQRLQAGAVPRRTAEEIAKARRLSGERLNESHDAVLRDIPEELAGVWASVGKRFKGGQGGAHRRAVQFLEWAEENPGEVVAYQQTIADRELARLMREERALHKKTRMRKTKAEIEAELAAVPF